MGRRVGHDWATSLSLSSVCKNTSWFCLVTFFCSLEDSVFSRRAFFPLPCLLLLFPAPSFMLKVRVKSEVKEETMLLGRTTLIRELEGIPNLPVKYLSTLHPLLDTEKPSLLPYWVSLEHLLRGWVSFSSDSLFIGTWVLFTLLGHWVVLHLLSSSENLLISVLLFLLG